MLIYGDALIIILRPLLAYAVHHRSNFTLASMMLLIGLLVVPVGRGPIIQSPPVQHGEHSQCHEC